MNPETASKNRGMRDLVRAIGTDWKRMAAFTSIACVVLFMVEYPLTLVFTPAPDLRMATVFRLVLVEGTFLVLLWGLVLMPLAMLLAVSARVAVGCFGSQTRLDAAADADAADDADAAADADADAGADARTDRTAAPGMLARVIDRAASWPGLFVPLVRPGVRPLAAWMWVLLVAAALYMAASSYITLRAITYFKEPKLTAILLSSLQLLVIAVDIGIAFVLARVMAALARFLDPMLGRYNPLGRVGPAIFTILLLGLVAVRVAMSIMPQLGPQVPFRHMLAAAVLIQGAWLGHWLLANRGRLLPAEPRARRRVLLATILAIVVLVPLTLIRVGADHETKSVAMTGSPLMMTMVDGVRKVTDFDDDGYGFLLGENDCAPFSGHIHPLARDIPDNGVDEDCNGRDFSLAMLEVQRDGAYMAVPESFQRDWNFLLLTIDTVRYDHTGFGGYIETKGRDTTPRLDELVARSVSFEFAQAPSAGTMASVPAIVTSKFFHSGIALDPDVKPRMPPRLRPENLLLAEVLRDQGYYNGAILSHQYFNDWGMEQGFDTYDNEVGAEYQPRRVTSHELTDKALAWVARNHRRDKWFLWVHYLDPHGYYVDHPGEPSFGTTEEDLYDGELRYTDKHVGRLLDELSRMPGADRTIVIITSDHGDAFNEHGFINHGQALYREILHVPLIFYIPELPPRQVPGAVTPLDIFPTVAELAGVDSRGLSVEGESLIPQLFYGVDKRERIVFAETNWPRTLRAAVSEKYKLVFKIQSNLYEFYDLEKDPWEKRNIYNKADSKALGRMKEAMDTWLERVYYARDPLMNQAESERLENVVPADTKPGIVPTSPLTFDEGRIRVLGMDPQKPAYRAGEAVEISVYFQASQPPSTDYRLQVELVPVTGDESVAAPVRPAVVASSFRTTGKGLFASSRWRPGQIVRDTFPIKLPAGWTAGERLQVSLRAADVVDRKNAQFTGPTRGDNAELAVLGEIPFTASENKASQPAPGTTPTPAGKKPPARPATTLPIPRQPSTPPVR